MRAQATAMIESISDVTAPDEVLSLLSRAFSTKLGESDLRCLLKHLNSLTTHRFTGVYRFEPGWVVSVALWDSENPSLELGADVKMKESYCWLTGASKNIFVIEDATKDDRLEGHAARSAVRSYVAVLLRDSAGTPWGTLCHFDFEAGKPGLDTIETLETFRPLVEEMLVRDSRAHWDPDASSEDRIARR